MAAGTEFPNNNGAAHTIAQIIKAVMLSAAEAEIGAMYINMRKAVPIRKTLIKLGHVRSPTPLQMDNSAAHSVVSRNVQPRRTKAMDMKIYWLHCRDAQGLFRY